MTSVPRAAAALSPDAARRIGRTANACLAVISLSAAALSYDGLHHLAIASGIPWALSWLVPVVVDGLILASSVSVVAETLSGLSTRWSWSLIAAGVSMSVVGNVIASPPDGVSRCVHAMPPIVLAVSLDTVLRLARHRAGIPVTRAHRRTAAYTSSAPRREHVTAPTSAATPPSPQASRTTRPTKPPAAGSRTHPTRDLVATMLYADATTTAAAIARELNLDPSWVRKLVRDLRAEPDDRPKLSLAATGPDL